MRPALSTFERADGLAGRAGLMVGSDGIDRTEIRKGAPRGAFRILGPLGSPIARVTTGYLL